MKKSFIYSQSFFALVGLFIALFISSCTKSEVTKSTDRYEAPKILSFESFEAFKEVKGKVISMSLKELEIYEESKGYKSFGRMCDEIYYSKGPEEFKSVEEIKEFVSKNNKYLQLTEDTNGEFSMGTSLRDNSNRYFINDDRMLRIGTSIYKVFETGVAMTDEKNYEVLKGISNESSITLFPSNVHFTSFISIPSKIVASKDDENNCGVEIQHTVTNGSNRTIIALSRGWWDGYDINNVPVTVCEINAIVRPQKRTLGVWFNCTRTLSCDLKIAVDINKESIWDRQYYYASESGTSASFLEYQFLDLATFGYWATPPMHFGGYDCWGSSPSAGPTYVQCNVELF